MNKVLNRPLFRKEALRKGVLKPIKAVDGSFIGPQQIRPPVVQGPAIGGPTVSNPRTQLMNVPQQGIFRRGLGSLYRYGASLPFFIGADLTGKFIESQNPNVSTPRKLIGQGIGGTAAALGAARIAPAALSLGFPGLIGFGLYAGGNELVKAGIRERKRINAMTPAEREKFFQQNRAKALDYMSSGISDEDLFGKFVPRPKKEKKVTEANPGAGRPSFRVKDKNLKDMGPSDELAQNQYAGAGEADLNKIQDSVINQTPPGDPRDQAKIPVVKQPEVKQPKTAAEKSITQDTNKKTANIIQTGGASDDPIFNQNIKLARQYFDELEKGQSSQAKLVFLSNLASGLMTGTTKRSGIGGALEVFGQALGPAVNNMVTVKLKEGELRARRREASIEAALEHMSYLNKAAQRSGPEKYGVIQVRGADGKIRNYNGVLLEDGTAATFGGLDANGREIFNPIGRGPIVIGGQVVGNFENFREQSTLDKRLYDIQDTLGNKYSALAVARDILKTLSQEDAEGRTPKAGAALKADLILKRFSGVITELTGGRVLQDDFANLDTGQIEGLVDRLYNDEAKKIREDDTLTAPEKSKILTSINKNTLLAQARGKVRKISGLSGAEQERLAVQEVTLIYALANTFKDQDRLTQRDINAAREIVNIISFRRSSKDVKDSISAIASQIEADIRRQELLFREGGGLESTIKALRDLGLYKPFETAQEIQGLAKDLSKEEIEEGLGDIQL